MYQGKFDEKNRQKYLAEKARNDVVRKDHTRTEKAPAEKVRTASPKSEPVRSAPVKTEPVRTSEPVRSASKSKKTRKKGSPVATAVFYTFYFLFVLAFFVGTFFLLEWLHGWLTDYEASQPTTRNEEIFEELFADPDWGYMYDQAGVADTLYEGRDAYVSYMENKVGDSELTYMETSAGLSGGRKYYVKLGEEKVAAYTLVDVSDTLKAELPNWQLGTIEVFFERTETVQVEKQDGETVYINGIALDDSCTIKTVATLAEEYLPLGTTGARTHLQQLTGLLTEPEVTVQNASGETVEVIYDEAAGIYRTASMAAEEIPEDLKDRVIKAAQTYGKYMCELVGAGEVARYFDTNSTSYKTMTKIDKFMQEWFYSGHDFANESVTGYTRYTEDLFSVHVSMSMNVKRTDGTVKEYALDQTYFYENQNGTWKIIEMTNVDVTQQTGQVRLTFMDGANLLSSEMYDMSITQLTTPVLTAPEGKVFSGWYREEVGEDGTTTYAVVFVPDETGIVNIPTGTTLEPMTLYPLFETPSETTETDTETEGA